MLTLSEIEAYYPENLRGFKRFILREYLQHKLLQLLFDSEYAQELCFLGGTALRIVHGNTRFSGDLDFDNFSINEDTFNKVSDILQKQLEAEGYEVEMQTVYKGAYHCYIRFPELLYKEGLSGHKEEKILIQLDTEPQHYTFEPEKFILNKFDVFTQIFVTPMPLLLAQKFYAVCNRERNKGRDFFDIAFLLSRTTKPDYGYLELKLGITTPLALKDRILEKCNKISMEEMAKDVQPFLFYARDVQKILLFEELIQQAAL